jgi:hypothetical protein
MNIKNTNKRVFKTAWFAKVLAKGGQYWIYQYLFAKSDRDNIDDNELVEFRKLAKLYTGLSLEVKS